MTKAISINLDMATISRSKKNANKSSKYVDLTIFFHYIFTCTCGQNGYFKPCIVPCLCVFS